MDNFYNENAGIVLTLKNRNLSKSEVIDISNVPRWASNPDNVCIICGKCNLYMEYKPGPPLKGKWICNGCGTGVTELRVYNKIDKDVDDWNRQVFGDEDIDGFLNF